MKRKKQSYWAGFDLGGTKMRVAVLDASFRPVARGEAPTQGFEGVGRGVRKMADLLRRTWQEVARKKKRARLRGIGLACPGPVKPDTGEVIEMPNVGWRNVPLSRLLRQAARAPVAVLNDVDAGTYGEYRFGAGRKGRCVIGVFPGTGVGGGCVMNGRILTGADTSCMEIGHLPVQPDGPLCGCGQRGCLEAVCSRLAIAQAAVTAVYRNESPYLLKSAGMDIRNVRSKALARAIEAGDAAVERIVRDAAAWLGVGVAAVVNLLAPDVVVLGGGLVEAMPRLYRIEVGRTARSRVMRTFRRRFRLAVAELGDDAALLGAAAWAAETVSSGRAGKGGAW
jgi:glucokinase